MRVLISAWRCSVPLCFGIVRSISRRPSSFSCGSRAGGTPPALACTRARGWPAWLDGAQAFPSGRSVDPGVRDELPVRLLEPGTVLVRFFVDQLADAGLDGLLGAAEARPERGVEEAPVRRVAVARREDDRVLLGVDAHARVVPRARRRVRGAAGTPAVGAVADAHRRAVVPGGDDRLLDDDDRPYSPADAVRACGDRARDAHVVLVPARPLHRRSVSPRARGRKGFIPLLHGRRSGRSAEGIQRDSQAMTRCARARSCLSRLPSRATPARVLPRQEEIAAR